MEVSAERVICPKRSACASFYQPGLKNHYAVLSVCFIYSIHVTYIMESQVA